MSTGRLGAGDTAIQPTILDAKGDLIVATAADTPARLAVGSNNQTLLADSAQSTGVKWGSSPQSLMTATGDLLYASSANTPARLAIGSTSQVLTVSGGIPAWATPSSGGMTLINTGGTALTGTSVTISSIPTTYNKLFCVVRNMTVSTDNGNFRIRLNGDSTANRYRNIYSWGASDDQLFNEDYIVGQRGSDNTADDNLAFFEIVDYANTTTWKVVNVQSVSQNATTPANINQLQSFGYYNQLSAITSIEIYASSGSFNSGTAYLYGVK